MKLTAKRNPDLPQPRQGGSNVTQTRKHPEIFHLFENYPRIRHFLDAISDHEERVSIERCVFVTGFSIGFWDLQQKFQ